MNQIILVVVSGGDSGCAIDTAVKAVLQNRVPGRGGGKYEKRELEVTMIGGVEKCGR